jgi:hypothetical protein
VIAINIDELELTSHNLETKTQTSKTLTGEEAQQRGYFDGPPYGPVEKVFDEEELEDLEPVEPR